MAREIKPATPETVHAIKHCMSLLAGARAAADLAEAPRLARRIRATIKSAEGALRHAEHRLQRTK